MDLLSPGDMFVRHFIVSIQTTDCRLRTPPFCTPGGSDLEDGGLKRGVSRVNTQRKAKASRSSVSHKRMDLRASRQVRLGSSV